LDLPVPCTSMPRASALVLALCILLCTLRATAEERCPALTGGTRSLQAISAERRLAFVVATVRDQARRARTWSLAWTLTGLGLSAANFTLAGLTDDRADRVDRIIAGSSSLTLPAAMLIDPLRVVSDQPKLEVLLDAVDWRRGGMECLVLGRAEDFLVRDADDEHRHARFSSHLLGIGYNIGVALVLGLGLGHWRAAILNGVGGILISEARLLTQPTGAVSALERYRAGDLGDSTLTARPVSVGVGLAF
ncbi:MAG: hypothetical protein JWM74_3792, partial [Myxococcaceae bacterium]|nr:hypothetical protein [Myxococcaceae bacterium]